MKREDFIDFVHQYIREYISIADRKASFFFAGFSATLAFLQSKNVLKLHSNNLGGVLCTVSAIALLLGALFCLLVIFPRLKGSSKGLIFWEAINEYSSYSEFIDDVNGTSEQNLSTEVLKHSFELANVCSKKYNYLNKAILFGFSGLACSLLYIVFFCPN